MASKRRGTPNGRERNQISDADRYHGHHGNVTYGGRHDSDRRWRTAENKARQVECLDKQYGGQLRFYHHQQQSVEALPIEPTLEPAIRRRMSVSAPVSPVPSPKHTPVMSPKVTRVMSPKVTRLASAKQAQVTSPEVALPTPRDWQVASPFDKGKTRGSDPKLPTRNRPSPSIEEHDTGANADLNISRGGLEQQPRANRVWFESHDEDDEEDEFYSSARQTSYIKQTVTGEVEVHDVDNWSMESASDDSSPDLPKSGAIEEGKRLQTNERPLHYTSDDVTPVKSINHTPLTSLKNHTTLRVPKLPQMTSPMLVSPDEPESSSSESPVSFVVKADIVNDPGTSTSGNVIQKETKVANESKKSKSIAGTAVAERLSPNQRRKSQLASTSIAKSCTCNTPVQIDEYSLYNTIRTSKVQQEDGLGLSPLGGSSLGGLQVDKAGKRFNGAGSGDRRSTPLDSCQEEDSSHGHIHQGGDGARSGERRSLEDRLRPQEEMDITDDEEVESVELHTKRGKANHPSGSAQSPGDMSLEWDYDDMDPYYRPQRDPHIVPADYRRSTRGQYQPVSDNDNVIDEIRDIYHPRYRQKDRTTTDEYGHPVRLQPLNRRTRLGHSHSGDRSYAKQNGDRQYVNRTIWDIPETPEDDDFAYGLYDLDIDDDVIESEMEEYETRVPLLYRLTRALSPPSPEAETMIGAAGSRHLSTRRRSSMASLGQTHTPLSSSPMFGRLTERDEEGLRMSSVPRRRAVNTSDLRSCALVQSKMKTWKNYPE